jgi:hypothetical protein
MYSKGFSALIFSMYWRNCTLKATSSVSYGYFMPPVDHRWSSEKNMWPIISSHEGMVLLSIFSAFTSKVLAQPLQKTILVAFAVSQIYKYRDTNTTQLRRHLQIEKTLDESGFTGSLGPTTV